MKSIEEKAKAYDKVREKIVIRFGSNVADEIFSQFEMSEDEKIRKWIIDDIRYDMNNEPLNNSEYKKKAARAIAWLEKQAQNPDDKSKIKPKFKTGDRVIGVVSGMPYFITKVCDDHYNTESGCIIMFCAQDNFDLYEQKPAWSEDDINMIDWLIRCCEKEHEELCNDRYGHQEIVSDLKRDCRKKWDWLESLKDKVVPQPKQEWSEEDEKGLGDALWCCNQAASIAKDENDMGNCWYAKHWLKSLRPKKQWKPSDEQMKALANALSLAKNCGEESAFDLRTLQDDLKRLLKI